MVCLSQQTTGGVWGLAAAQHGAVARRQLVELGLSKTEIQHRVRRGRLHRVFRGVYAVGRPELSEKGRWMAAVLACGETAVLSHRSAAALWGIAGDERGVVDVTVRVSSDLDHAGIYVHRRPKLRPEDLVAHDRIPVTSPVRTLLDLATQLRPDRLERVVNEADRHDLIDPEALRATLDGYRRQPGVAILRILLDHRTFRMTDSELERRFLPLVAAAGLPLPQTRQYVNGFKVDFLWPELGLVVETDGLRYHRTPAQQARDRLRDQRHTAAGLTPLRFTHAQVRYEGAHVCDVLAAVARRLG